MSYLAPAFALGFAFFIGTKGPSLLPHSRGDSGVSEFPEMGTESPHGG